MQCSGCIVCVPPCPERTNERAEGIFVERVGCLQPAVCGRRSWEIIPKTLAFALQPPKSQPPRRYVCRVCGWPNGTSNDASAFAFAGKPIRRPEQRRLLCALLVSINGGLVSGPGGFDSIFPGFAFGFEMPPYFLSASHRDAPTTQTSNKARQPTTRARWEDSYPTVSRWRVAVR